MTTHSFRLLTLVVAALALTACEGTQTSNSVCSAGTAANLLPTGALNFRFSRPDGSEPSPFRKTTIANHGLGSYTIQVQMGGEEPAETRQLETCVVAGKKVLVAHPAQPGGSFDLSLLETNQNGGVTVYRIAPRAYELSDAGIPFERQRTQGIFGSTSVPVVQNQTPTASESLVRWLTPDAAEFIFQLSK